MGAWGTKLYQDDVTEDVRDHYKDQLKRGKSNEEIVKEMLIEFDDYISDPDDEPLFWFALADTQWKLGRLLPEVKKKALEHLKIGSNLERWQIEGSKKDYEKRKAVLYELAEQLNTPMPEKKKIRQYRLYQTDWKNGDVYAYQFHSEESKEYNLYGKYLLFRKTTEGEVWPGHICPVVHVYRWIGEDIPEASMISDLDCIPMTFHGTPRKYELKIETKSKSKIPHKYLTFLDNITTAKYPKEERIVGDLSKSQFSWKVFERGIIKRLKLLQKNDDGINLL
ncbi:hypothetical protein [Haloplasma contractile]|uniref:DUF4259 domain-containing protein n=1 Tax=Haloplasma contractile SSD-17B TaxID=1033810 RepID=U2FKG4_9MOLU|nr:hypothetical protein [Haloplasma contractile]ERJ13300.1 hypothetical protein HLPCO_000929 [Haloplasma contractile SSD-17B]